MNNEITLIEAILFLESTPISIEELSKTVQASPQNIIQALLDLQKKYLDQQHGLELISVDNRWQIIPKRSLWNLLAPRYAKEQPRPLSRSAKETLSIIAYNQPITRLEIDGIRGVSSISMISLLKEQNLVQDIGKKNVLGSPIQYGTTEFFLKKFQLSSISDLPKLDEIEQSQFLYQ